MPYLKVIKSSIVKKTPLGKYLYAPYGFQLESFYPILEIDEAVEHILALCDGTHTREDLLQLVSQQTGDPIQEFEADFDAFVDYMIEEGILEWSGAESPVEPLHKRNKPFSISFDITYACNLRCPFCSVTAGEPWTDELTTDDITPFLEQVKTLKPSPVMINGGEPLMRKDFLLHILEELSQVGGITVPVLTNGTLITKEYAEDLKDAGLTIGRVGIDGHTAQLHDAMRGQGTFKKAMDGVNNLKECGIHVNIIAVITRLNYPYLQDIVEFLETTADSYNVAPVYPFGRTTQDMLLTQEEVFKVKTAHLKGGKIETLIAPRTRCDAGDVIHIAGNGDIFPCFYMQFPEYRLGNIKGTTLSSIYDTDIMSTVLELDVHGIEECRTCEIRYFCGGGCRGFAHAMSGSVLKPDPLDCESNKILVNQIKENGEEITKKVLQEMLESTRTLGV
ncbi:MAG: radical SAM protein [Theionarchaea archaeon]|nr:radical SAM protein [Theionarchaea archaeon]MBU7038475.1 radical SAM protein [Theionarchaea archaeon]